MGQKHKDLLAAAKKAVNDLFSDTSVDSDETKESLDEVREEVNELLSTIPKGKSK